MMGLRGIVVNGVTYKLDYSALDNLPDLQALVLLPAHTADDEGKIVVVNNAGEWALGKALPVPQATDVNQFLTVDEDGNWVLRSLASTVVVSPLPSVDEHSAGCVLAVDRSGTWSTCSLFSVLAGVNDVDSLALDEYYGKVAVVNSQGEIVLSDFSIVDLYETVVSLSSQLTQLQARVAAIESNTSGTQASVADNKVTLNGSGLSVSGEKLVMNGASATVSGEKLSIA